MELGYGWNIMKFDLPRVPPHPFGTGGDCPDLPRVLYMN